MPKQILLGDFARKLRNIAKTAPNYSDDVVKHLATTIDYTLITITPIDTGRAKSNWWPGINTIPTVYRHPQPKKPSSPTAGIKEAIDALHSIIGRFTGDGIIFIANNAPYVHYLNTNRPSPQAPPGFIEAAIENAREQLRPHVKELTKAWSGIPVRRLGDRPVMQTVVQPRNVGVQPIGVGPRNSAVARRPKRSRR